MIEFYTWNGADGHNVAIMLEAIREPYSVYPVDTLNRAEQPIRFQEISPNKVPALVDPDGPGGSAIALFGSAPILLYLAEKSGEFLPESTASHYECLQWLMWQQSDVAPVLTNLQLALKSDPDQLSTSLEHQVGLLWQALANQLSGRRFICGEDLTIADFALYPWVESVSCPSLDPRAFPPIACWLEQLADISFAQHGLQIP